MTTDRNRFLLKNGLTATIKILDPQQTLTFLESISRQKSSAKSMASRFDCVALAVNLKGEMVYLAYLEQKENDSAKFCVRLRRNLEKGKWEKLLHAFFTIYDGTVYPLGDHSARIIQNAIRNNVTPQISSLLT
jgi:hypothetical protein